MQIEQENASQNISHMINHCILLINCTMSRSLEKYDSDEVTKMKSYQGLELS